MSSSQCVPSWDLDDAVPTTRPHAGSSSGGPDVPMLDYEVAELTWENGQLSMHGLGLPRPSSKPRLKQYACAMGTLESIVDLATQPPPAKDALVPCETGVGSCSGAADEASVLKRAPCVVPVAATAAQWNREQSVSGSGGTLGADSWHVPTVDTCEKELGGFGLTSTSFCSQGNTFSSSGRPATTNNDDHDSVCHSRPQREAGNEEDEERKRNGKSSSSTRRSRAAAIHNQSERKRRDKINQKMKMLQKLVPNSNKTDKASMLDEVIDYLKQLQAQVHMMSRMSVPPMMMPQLAMQQQQLQMSMMAAAAGMGLGAMAPMPAMPPMDMSNMGMGMGMNMNMNMAGMATRPNPMAAFMPMAGPWDGGGDARLPSQAVVPTDPISSYLACQPQPMTVEAYSRMIALIQQQQQQLASVSKHQ